MSDTLRIDRWLFFCRFFKSRSLATKAVSGGHVRLNGERASPGVKVKVGSRLEITRSQLTYIVTVTSIPSRRGPASEATACYDEDAASVMAREEHTAALRQDRMLLPKTRGRPDKHTRRKLISRNRG
ncbi:MAG: RNA-binding S4 domain-containing protein [Pseudomonadota bacterium]